MRGYKVLEVHPGATWVVAVLSRRIHGVMVHWMGSLGERRARMCLTDPRKCPGCQGGCPKLWEGWLAAQLGPGRLPRLVKITSMGWETCPELQEADGALRGRLLKCSRADQGAQGRMLYELGGQLEEAKLIPEFNVPKALAVLYGLSATTAQAWVQALADAWALPETSGDPSDPNIL